MSRTNDTMRELRKTCRDAGMALEFRNGTKHRFVYVDGQMVGVLSYGSNSQADGKNLVASVRRLARSRRATA